MNSRVLRVCASIAAAMLMQPVPSDAAPLAGDPDAERVPPEDIGISMKEGTSSRLGSGYLWRMANRIHLAWAAQKPVSTDEDQFFWLAFFVYPDGSVSDLKLTDTKLDANGKKAVRAFLEAIPFEALPKGAQESAQDPVALKISIWLKAKKPDQALEPTPMSVTPPAAQEPRRP